MLIHPSSGACDLFVELFHGLYCSGSMCVGVTLWFGCGGVLSVCRLKHYFMAQAILSQIFTCIYTLAISSQLFFLLTPPTKMEQSVSKRRYIHFRCRIITQKKEYNIILGRARVRFLYPSIPSRCTNWSYKWQYSPLFYITKLCLMDYPQSQCIPTSLQFPFLSLNYGFLQRVQMRSTFQTGHDRDYFN